jgi:hypothetical protein
MRRLPVTIALASAAVAALLTTSTGSSTSATATAQGDIADRARMTSASTQGRCDDHGRWRIVMRPASDGPRSLEATVTVRDFDPGSQVSGSVSLENKGSASVLIFDGQVENDGTFRVPVGTRADGMHRLTFDAEVDRAVCQGRMSSITR